MHCERLGGVARTSELRQAGASRHAIAAAVRSGTIDRIREGAHDLIGLARRGRKVAATGNSDSHVLLYQEAGWPRTWLHTTRDPREARGARVLEALAARHTQVSSGPLIELSVSDFEGDAPREHEAGDTLSVHGGVVTVTLRVWAASWVPVSFVELWSDDEVVRSFEIPAVPSKRPMRPGLRFETRFELPIERDTVLLALAQGNDSLPDVLPYSHARAVAFTSLLYVDADGDGEVRIPPR